MDALAESEPMTRWQRIGEYVDWKSNPVMVRDLRLYMRGKALPIFYFLTLAGLLMCAIGYFLLAKNEGADGRALLRYPLIILCLFCGAFVPNLIGEGARAEFSAKASELVFVSALSPARLIRGKLLVAYCMSMLAFSLATPVFATAYLLGGIGPVDIFYLILALIVPTGVMPLLPLYFAARGKKSGIGGRAASAGVFLGSIVLMVYYAYLLDMALLSQFSAARTFEVVIALLSILIAAVLIGQFLYFVTVSRLRGLAENRDAIPRISLTVAAILGWGAALCLLSMVGASTDLGERMGIATLCTASIFCWSMIIIAGKNAVQPRVLRDSWQGKPLRRLFLSTGAASLTAYFCLHGVMFVALGVVGILLDFSNNDTWRSLGVTLAFLQLVAWGLVGYHYVAKLLFRSLKPDLVSNTIIIANVILGMLAVFFEVILKVTGSAFEELRGCTPVGLLTGVVDHWSVPEQVVIVGVVTLLLLLLLLVPQALREWRTKFGNHHAG